MYAPSPRLPPSLLSVLSVVNPSLRAQRKPPNLRRKPLTRRNERVILLELSLRPDGLIRRPAPAIPDCEEDAAHVIPGSRQWRDRSADIPE